MSFQESGRFCRVIALVMYLPATARASFGSGTVFGVLLASTTGPGGVATFLVCAVLPKNAIRNAMPPATKTSAAAYGSIFVTRRPKLC